MDPPQDSKLNGEISLLNLLNVNIEYPLGILWTITTYYFIYHSIDCGK